MDQVQSAIEEIALSGQVGLGRCSDSTLYRWASKINERLERDRYDWRVKAVRPDLSITAIPIADYKPRKKRKKG